MIQVYDLTWLWVLYMMTVGVGHFTACFSFRSFCPDRVSFRWLTLWRSGRTWTEQSEKCTLDCCSRLLLFFKSCIIRTVAHKTMLLTDCCPQDHASYGLLQIVSYIILRNVPGWLRTRYSSFFAWFGKISLEVMFSHTWYFQCYLVEITYRTSHTHSRLLILSLSLSLWQSDSQSSQAIAVVLR